MNNDNYIITDRGGVVENRHAIHAAVVDGNGNLLYSVGNPHRLTLVRSTAKPSQALAILETGCFDQFDLDDADLALMCASHNSEPHHLERVRSLLNKIGVTEEHLACGGHPSLSEVVNRVWIKNDVTPTAVHNNCSGKHAGMIAGSKAIGARIDDYHLSEHPMKLRVKRVFEELCGEDAEGLQWGIDGCNLPAPATPLNVLARVYGSFAAAVDTVQTGTAVKSRVRDSSRIFHAMSTFPENVAGEGRFCTELMRAVRGTLIGKLGADGCYAIGVRASDQTRRLGSEGVVGIAVKVEDGNISVLYAAVVEVLKQLQLGTDDLLQKLASFHPETVLNTVGAVTGCVSFQFKLGKVESIHSVQV
jgi:L-asparaginase II